MSTNRDQPNTPPDPAPAGPTAKPPVQVTPLSYAPVDPNQPRTSVAKQFVAGLLLPLAYVFPAGFLVGIMPGNLGPPMALVTLIGFGVLVIVIRIKTRWTGFIPGVVTMVLGIPLLAAGVCAIVVATGGMNSH